MINTIHARVLGAMRYSMDNGIKGAKITLMNEADSENENRVGHEVMTITAPYDLFDKIQPFAGDMPCNLEIDTEMRTTQGKMTMHAVGIRKPAATGHPGGPSTKADAKAS